MGAGRGPGTRARPRCWAGAARRLSLRRRPAGVRLRPPLPLPRLPLASPRCRGEGSQLTLSSPSAATSLLVSFLSYFWGWGAWRLRKCAQGHRPGRGRRCPAPLPPTRPAGTRLQCAPGREGPDAEPRAVLEGLSRLRTPAPAARRPSVCLTLGLNRPAGA